MVPMVQLWRPHEALDEAKRNPHIGVNVDGPNPPEHDQARNGRQRKTHHDRSEIQHGLGVDRVQRMLAVGSQPIQVFRRMVDRMKTPKEVGPVLESMAPVHAQVANKDHFDGL